MKTHEEAIAPARMSRWQRGARLLTGIWNSFAVKLVLHQLKRHHMILAFWIALILIVTGNMGGAFGMPYLFLDPEYLSKVNWLSFFITGAALGGFIMAYQITSYILNSYRFPFLATLQHPLFTYMQNNAFIPLCFLVTYMVAIARFQSSEEFTGTWDVIGYELALLAGMSLIILIGSTYFFGTNKNVFHLMGVQKKPGEDAHIEMQKTNFDWDRAQTRGRMARVDTYLTRTFRPRPVRGVEHYDARILMAVFRQHHVNALLVEILILASLVAMGYLMENRVFIIPAAASMMVLFATLIMLIGAFNYWTGRWRTTAFIGLVTLVAMLVKLDIITYRNKAVGLDYSKHPVRYSFEVISNAANSERIEADKAHTLAILENWKNRTGAGKPLMIMVQASGGGHRSSLWAVRVMQRLDSITGGHFSKHAMLMTGASGGMYGLAYYRELLRRRQTDPTLSLIDQRWLDNISKDLINPVGFTIVVNDLFYPWQSFRVDGHKYRKDRAYMFDKYFNINTDNFLDKKLGDYRDDEFHARIPMMILAPTVIRDERKLFISTQPVSYLCSPAGEGFIAPRVVDGIDFGTFFKQHGSDNLRMTCALRMNATYPYILPNVTLPTDPPIQVMDAGIRDNYGLETTSRFIFAFRDWIRENTSGVIIVNLNSVNSALIRKEDDKAPDAFSRLFNPVSNLYENWTEIQRYNQHMLFAYMREWLGDNTWYVEFNYVPSDKDQVASMSFHLTSKEKRDIINAIDNEANREAMEFVAGKLAP